jgi:hypothetical protein
MKILDVSKLWVQQLCEIKNFHIQLNFDWRAFKSKVIALEATFDKLYYTLQSKEIWPLFVGF